MEKGEAISRLRTIRLQIDEIARLVAETKPGLDSVQRLRAVQTDLWHIHNDLLNSDLDHHLAALRQQGDGAARTLKEIGALFCCK